MLTVEGIYEDGVVRPVSPLPARNGDRVLLTIAEPKEQAEATEWDSLDSLIDVCQMDAGITDLARQHDHYLHGTPKHT